MAIVYASSTELGTYDKSLNLILRFSYWLSPGMTIPGDVGAYFPINNAARIVARVFVFAVFTLLTVRALQWGHHRLKPVTLGITFLLALPFSFSDALFRLNAPDRHVRVEQFVLNGIGAVVVLLGVVVFFFAKQWETSLLALAGNLQLSNETAEVRKEEPAEE